MGTPRVLVAAESRHGSTREVAEAIAGHLTAGGCRVDLLTLEEIGALRPYDGVVLGSGMYLGRWLQPARRFMVERADEIRACAVWLFSSGPVGSPPFPDPETAFDPSGLVEATGARGHRLFTRGPGHGEPGDTRDWAAIEEWSNEIADAVHALNPGRTAH